MSVTAQRTPSRRCRVHIVDSKLTELLLTRIAAGQHTALSALYELTVDRVHRQVSSMLVSTNDVQAVVCDTYVAIWHGASRLRTHDYVGVQWLLDIATHQAAEHAKNDRRCAQSPT